MTEFQRALKEIEGKVINNQTLMKTYKVAAYVQDGDYTPTQRANMYKEYEVKAKDETDAENKADKKYYKEMGFTPDTVEVIN